MEIQGKFDAQIFFETLARILSEREHVKITVKITDKTENCVIGESVADEHQ